MRSHKRSKSVQPFAFGRRLSSRYHSGERRSHHPSEDSPSAAHHSGAAAAYESVISEGELAVIQTVLQRAEQITTMEQQRIG